MLEFQRATVDDVEAFMQANIEAFKKELNLLGGHPVLVALGGATYDFLTETLGHEYKIVKIKHF